jgi:hypothetical protein
LPQSRRGAGVRGPAGGLLDQGDPVADEHAPPAVFGEPGAEGPKAPVVEDVSSEPQRSVGRAEGAPARQAEDGASRVVDLP